MKKVCFIFLSFLFLVVISCQSVFAEEMSFIIDLNGRSESINTITRNIEAAVAGPSITKQPTNVKAEEGTNITIGLTASGSGLTYQWYYKTKASSSFKLWGGRTTARINFDLTANKNGMQVYCIVKDSSGKSIQSDTITLTIETADAGLSITKQPTNVKAEEGTSITIGLTASGSGLTYQWYYKTKASSSFKLWGGRTTASISFDLTASKNGMQVYCIVKDSSGKSIQSDTVTLTIETADAGLSITKQPTNVKAEEGTKVTIGLTASGSGLTYQWYYKTKASSSFKLWGGRTTASISFDLTSSKNGMQVYCIVKDSNGKTVQSDTVTLTVKAAQPVTIPSVGSNYIFGSYEQDNNVANGKELIEWIVLDKSGTKVMLISKYCLDCQLYNTESTDVTWETCSLRKWLNSTFINSAFSTAEKGKLVSTTVTAAPNPQYSTDPGNNTTDKVYLLSIAEAAKYFTSNEARMCIPTSYAIANGVWTGTYYTVGGKGTCWWWLRTSGDQSYHVAGVCCSGEVDSTGPVNFDVYAVRPVIWIDLAS